MDLTSQLQTPAFAEDITIQPIIKPLVNLTSDLPVGASQPPIPPPPVFQPPKIILLVGEPRPLSEIKPTVYKSLTPDLLRDQINKIDLYIKACNLALDPYKQYFEELKEMKEAIKLMQDDLKLSQKALVECESKFNYLKEKCNENKIATFNIQGRTVLPPFQMYPMEIYKEIAGRINPHASFPAIDDFHEGDSMNTSSLDDLNLSPVNPSFHHHSGFSSDNSSSMGDGFDMFQAASSVKETFKNIMCDDLPKNNKPSLQKDIELSISEKHLKTLEKYCKAIEIEVQERKLAITELEAASRDMEENSFDVYDQTNETSLEVNYTVKQMETLLVEKYNHLNAWLRHKNSRVQELDKKEKNQPAKPLPQQVLNEIPDDLVKQYPEILNTLKMPQHIAIQLTKIKNANGTEDEEMGPTLQYIYSIYKQLIIPES